MAKKWLSGSKDWNDVAHWTLQSAEIGTSGIALKCCCIGFGGNLGGDRFFVFGGDFSVGVRQCLQSRAKPKREGR